MKKSKNTVLLGLNELNFEFISYYISKGKLKNFKRLFELQNPIKTTSESEYRLLEPWVQWVTIHTGKSYSEHKIFRLGDIVNKPKLLQIFEELESQGLSVGAVSPFNAENRLSKPSFFIPDPWTKTQPHGDFFTKKLYEAIHQSVNDNASKKLNFGSLISILIAFIIHVPISRWLSYLTKFLSFRKPGQKAIILDSLLSDVFISLFKREKPEFSNLFLNSGAHIQHHYLFNSKAYNGKIKNPNWYCDKNYDPLIAVLNEYDNTIDQLLKIKDLKLIIATGLHQEPHQKITFYWRLKKHKDFIRLIGIENFSEVLPRMSRDFLILFKSEKEALYAESLLNSFLCLENSNKIFSVDNRGKSLFVELIYSKDISEDFSIHSNETNITINNFKSYVSFVAIKNGEHDGTGYLTANFDLNLEDTIELKSVNKIIKDTALNKI